MFLLLVVGKSAYFLLVNIKGYTTMKNIKVSSVANKSKHVFNNIVSHHIKFIEIMKNRNTKLHDIKENNQIQNNNRILILHNF